MCLPHPTWWWTCVSADSPEPSIWRAAWLHSCCGHCNILYRKRLEPGRSLPPSPCSSHPACQGKEEMTFYFPVFSPLSSVIFTFSILSSPSSLTCCYLKTFFLSLYSPVLLLSPLFPFLPVPTVFTSNLVWSIVACSMHNTHSRHIEWINMNSHAVPGS